MFMSLSMIINYKISFLLAFILCGLAINAYASDRCYVITDFNERAFCEAKSRNRPQTCAHISDADKRTYCEAVTRNRPQACSRISNSFQRSICESDATQAKE